MSSEEYLLIPVGRSRHAKVDRLDYEALSCSKWQISGAGYAIRNPTTSERHSDVRQSRLMHRIILRTSPGILVDHINGDRLDNRRSNLRECNAAQNTWNSPAETGSVSQYKGVSKTARGTWTARLRVNGELHILGCFKCEIAAAIAVDQAAIRLHGEFARLNLPRSLSCDVEPLPLLGLPSSTPNKSGYRGVCAHRGCYEATINSKTLKRYLGRFTDPEAAARAYDIAAIEAYGFRAQTNFPLTDYGFVSV